jgi:uncharacterized protein
MNTSSTDARAQEVAIEIGDHQLAGTLWLPSRRPPYAAVALLHGAGHGVRTDYITPIREAFCRAEFAVLAWDRPGCGESTGDWQRQSLEDRSDEALAAVRLLKSHPEIAPARIGLWGQSQGANVASLAAARSTDVAFVAATSPAGTTLVDVQSYGLECALRADGASEEQIQAAVTCVRAIQEADRRGDTYEQLEINVLGPARRQPWGRYFTSPPLPDASTWQYWRTRGGLPDQNVDPVPIWDNVRCPVIVMWGELDTVMPVPDVATLTKAALVRAGNQDATVRVFAGAGHGIELIGTGQPAPGYLELLASWARAHVGLA